MKTVKAVLLVAAIFILACGVSYGMVIGLLKLITMCFGIAFNLKIATGGWLVILLFNFLFFKDRVKE